MSSNMQQAWKNMLHNFHQLKVCTQSDQLPPMEWALDSRPLPLGWIHGQIGQAVSSGCSGLSFASNP